MVDTFMKIFQLGRVRVVAPLACLLCGGECGQSLVYFQCIAKKNIANASFCLIEMMRISKFNVTTVFD